LTAQILLLRSDGTRFRSRSGDAVTPAFTPQNLEEEAPDNDV
jgi:hypothetical protein